jgi:hypothetical protein
MIAIGLLSSGLVFVLLPHSGTSMSTVLPDWYIFTPPHGLESLKTKLAHSNTYMYMAQIKVFSTI